MSLYLGLLTTFKRRKLGRLSFDRHFARNEVSGFYCLIMLHTSKNTATKVLIFFERKHSDFFVKTFERARKSCAINECDYLFKLENFYQVIDSFVVLSQFQKLFDKYWI